MEFDKSRVYTALNADELRAGDKVIVAISMNQLRKKVADANNHTDILTDVGCDELCLRFYVGASSYPLVYLVERKENCTNCGNSKCDVTFASCFHRCNNWTPKTESPDLISLGNGQYAERTTKINTKHNLCSSCKHSFAECPATINDIVFGDGVGNDNVYECTHYKPKTEKKYRPFKDTDELIKVWCDKAKATPPVLDMPYIWVRRKEGNLKGQLITEFSNSLWVEMGKEGYNMTDLLVHFTFLDGSPCGVEE